MNSEVPQRTPKVPRGQDDDDLHEDDVQISKAKRHDVEVPISEVDSNLAKKLDSILNISDTRRPRFFMNKPKTSGQCDNQSVQTTIDSGNKTSLKSRNLTKEQLRQRLLEKYDTLVPELDPKRPTVKVVKVLSATESLELAKGEAKKQLEYQLELSSIRANQQATKNGIKSFKFKDGYELPAKCFQPGRKNSLLEHKSVSFAPNDSNDGVKATVKYFKPDENEHRDSNFYWMKSYLNGYDDDEDDDDEDDEDDEDDDEEEEDDDDDDEGEDVDKDDHCGGSNVDPLTTPDTSSK